MTGCDLVEDTPLGFEYQKLSILSPDFDTLFSKKEFDICINASGSGNVSYSLTNPISDFESNTFVVAKVLDTIRKYQPLCKYLHISSAAVYGNPERLPVKESDALSPLSPYGYHKLMSEQLCTEYHHLYNLSVAVIRPFSVYGNGLKKQLLWDICKKLSQNDKIPVYLVPVMKPMATSFLHISDLCELINVIIDKCAFDGGVYNAATGIEISIREIANIFEGYFPGKKQISFSGENKVGDPVNWRADISRIANAGFQPKSIV